jgi:hypothetical protein
MEVFRGLRSRIESRRKLSTCWSVEWTNMEKNALLDDSSPKSGISIPYQDSKMKTW